MKQLCVFYFFMCMIINCSAIAIWNELHDAVYDEDEEAVVQILSKKRTENQWWLLLNGQSKDGKTPLHYAVISGVKSILKKLLEHKPNNYVYDHNGLLPIHYAASQEDIEACDLLLRNGASIYDLTSIGETPLVISLFCKKKHAAFFFIGRGSNVNIIPQNGLTAIYWANLCGYYDIVRVLLAKGASTKVNGKELDIPPCCAENPIVRPVAQCALKRVTCTGDKVIIKIPRICFS